MLRLRNPMTMDQSAIGQAFPLAVEDDKWYVTHKYGGMDTLTFEVSADVEYYQYIQEEAQIETADSVFLIKNLDEHGGNVYADCVIDLDEWRAAFWHSYQTLPQTLAAAVESVKPDGWTVKTLGTFEEGYPVETEDGDPLEDVNALDVLNEICRIFSCVPQFDNISKIVTMINPDEMGDSGEYYSEEINLDAAGYVGDTSEFATRLYPYGATDEETGETVTIAEVNGGVPYLDNNVYCDKIISVGWTDENYKTPEALYNAAMRKLQEISSPSRSFELSVREVGDGLELYRTCTYMDIRRGTRTQHMCVEYKEYPDRPDLDTVTLSVVVPSVSFALLDDTDRLREIERREQILRNQAIDREKMEKALRNQYGISVEKDTETGSMSLVLSNDTDVRGNFTVNGEEVSGGLDTEALKKELNDNYGISATKSGTGAPDLTLAGNVDIKGNMTVGGKTLEQKIDETFATTGKDSATKGHKDVTVGKQNGSVLADVQIFGSLKVNGKEITGDGGGGGPGNISRSIADLYNGSGLSAGITRPDFYTLYDWIKVVTKGYEQTQINNIMNLLGSNVEYFKVEAGNSDDTRLFIHEYFKEQAEYLDNNRSYEEVEFDYDSKTRYWSYKLTPSTCTYLQWFDKTDSDRSKWVMKYGCYLFRIRVTVRNTYSNDFLEAWAGNPSSKLPIASLSIPDLKQMMPWEILRDDQSYVSPMLPTEHAYMLNFAWNGGASSPQISEWISIDENSTGCFDIRLPYREEYTTKGTYDFYIAAMCTRPKSSGRRDMSMYAWRYWLFKYEDGEVILDETLGDDWTDEIKATVFKK